MPYPCQSVSETVADIIAWRPVLSPVLKAFEPILTRRGMLAEEMESAVRDAGLVIPDLVMEKETKGVSLLAGSDLEGVGPLMAESASALFPLFAASGARGLDDPALAAFFASAGGDGDRRRQLACAVLNGSDDTIVKLAGACELEPGLLKFTGEMILSPVLRAMVRNYLHGREADDDMPWDEGNRWSQGYCPVCGSFPTIGWLDRHTLDKNNPYLKTGGGKKHLHCGLCGAEWKFRRGVCPACGSEAKGTMNILREEGPSHGERIDWCTECKAYCPIIDLREREKTPDMDAMALGMLHLDIVAADKKLIPLRHSFWNS